MHRLLTLVVLFSLLMAATPAAAAPPDDVDPPGLQELPPGLAKKDFIHYPKDHANAKPNESAAPVQVGDCGQPGSSTYNSPTCAAYGYSGTHWFSIPNGGIPYYINPNFNAKKSPRLNKNGAIAAIRASFAAWDEWNTKLAYGYKGTASTRPGRYDGRNVVGWGTLNAGALAVTTVWYWPDTGQIVETDITFNNGYAWSYTPPGTCGGSYCDPTTLGVANTYDVRDIGTHEVGHTLMLDDLYFAGSAGLTMHGYGFMASLNKVTLGNGDLLGLDTVYK